MDLEGSQATGSLFNRGGQLCPPYENIHYIKLAPLQTKEYLMDKPWT